MHSKRYELPPMRLGRILGMGLTTALTWMHIFDVPPAVADKKGASELTVRAYVPVRSELAILYQTPAITLTNADITCGYVDVRAATRISIKNNNRAGYLLLFEGLSRPFKEVLISGLLREVQIDTSLAFIHQAYTQKALTAELNYRFVLYEDARAGEYAWPIFLSLQPAP